MFCIHIIRQEKDLKQYMDDCGNIMSMTNVKVSKNFVIQWMLFDKSTSECTIHQNSDIHEGKGQGEHLF